MAAISNTNTRRIDLGGGVSLIFGNYTFTAGAGSVTFAVGAGMVLGVILNDQLSAEPSDYSGAKYSTSISGAINTLTIYGNAPVATAGTFLVILNTGG